MSSVISSVKPPQQKLYHCDATYLLLMGENDTWSPNMITTLQLPREVQSLGWVPGGSNSEEALGAPKISSELLAQIPKTVFDQSLTTTWDLSCSSSEMWLLSQSTLSLPGSPTGNLGAIHQSRGPLNVQTCNRIISVMISVMSAQLPSPLLARLEIGPDRSTNLTILVRTASSFEVKAF